MTLFQALLIGLFAYLGSKRTPWFFGVTGGWNMIGRPLVAGLIVGIILGDVTNGVIAGAMVQALFIGQITPGGAMPADVNWAAYIGIPLAMAAGGTGEQAVALSVPLSMLGLGLFNFIMTIIWATRPQLRVMAQASTGQLTWRQLQALSFVQAPQC